MRACVDRGVTDAVLNLAAPGGRGLSLRLAPSIIFCVGGRAAATETFLTERASGLRASSVCVRSVAFPFPGRQATFMGNFYMVGRVEFGL